MNKKQLARIKYLRDLVASEVDLDSSEQKELADLETMEKGASDQASTLEAIGEVMDQKLAPIAERLDAVEAKSAVASKPVVETPGGDDATDSQKAMGLLMRGLKNGDESMIKQSQELIRTKGLAEGTDSDGGYLVPTEFHKEILRTVEEYGSGRKIFRKIPMSTNRKDVTAVSGKPLVYRPGEGTAPAQLSDFGFSQKFLEMKKVMCIVVGTSELIEDNQSDTDIWDLVRERVGEAIAEEEDESFFNGDGSANKDTGLFASTDPNLTDLIITANTYGGAHPDELLDLQTRVSKSIRKKGVYLMSQSVFDVYRKHKDSNGQYIIQQPQGGRPATLWDKPVEIVEVLPEVADASQGSKRFVGFGDPKMAAVYGDRRSMTIKKLEEATVGSINLGETDQSALRFTQRKGLEVVYGAAMAFLKTSA